MKKLLFTLGGVITMFCVCNFSNVSVNDQQDNEDGKAFVNAFYVNIANKDYKKIDASMTDSLEILAGPDGSSKLLQSINNKTGNYKSYTIADYYIKNEAGSNDVISYNYKLKVTYENGTIDEVIGLKKYGSAIQLNYYNANTDLLMK